MLFLLSPAKTLDVSETTIPQYAQPRLLAEANTLVNDLKQLDTQDLQALMGISEKLAVLNRDRYQTFSTPFSTENAKPALLMFKGDVYTGLAADTLSESALQYAHQHVRILSGLYGVLRAMDLMQPYRLEMGTALSTKKGKNLYEFWGHKITELINHDLKEHGFNTVINLASKEYFKAIKTEELTGRLIHIHFKEERNGKWRVIAFNAKKARGSMTRYAIDESISDPEQLKNFTRDGYMFNPELSDQNNWTFTR